MQQKNSPVGWGVGAEFELRFYVMRGPADAGKNKTGQVQLQWLFYAACVDDLNWWGNGQLVLIYFTSHDFHRLSKWVVFSVQTRYNSQTLRAFYTQFIIGDQLIAIALSF